MKKLFGPVARALATRLYRRIRSAANTLCRLSVFNRFVSKDFAMKRMLPYSEDIGFIQRKSVTFAC